jgi:hypothetical protein
MAMMWPQAPQRKNEERHRRSWFDGFVFLWLVFVFIQAGEVFWSETFQIDRFLIQIVLIYYLNKRAYWAQIAAMIWAGLGSASFCLTVLTLGRQAGGVFLLVWVFYALFYLGAFIILSNNHVKTLFPRKRAASELPVLDKNEVFWIKQTIRFYALLLFAYALSHSIFQKQLSAFEFKIEPPFIIILFFLTSVGLLAQLKYGRYLGIMVGFLSFGAVIVEFISPSSGQFAVRIINITVEMVFFSMVPFLLHPKTRGFFKN